jgi:hypothetical protein
VFLALLDVGQVRADDALRITGAFDPSGIEPQRLVAEALDQPERMRDEQDRLAAALELGELVEALVGESLVADRQDFVHEQDVRIDVDRHRETEPHVHARRIGLDRRVDELLQLGELDDLVEALRHPRAWSTEHDPVDENVLAAGDLRMEPGAELDQRGNAAETFTVPLDGLVMPATSFSSVLFPEPFRPMTPSVRPRGTVSDTSLSAVNVSSGLRFLIRLRVSSALFSVANCLRWLKRR